MLSFSKLILLAFVIAVVWFGWRWVRRVEAVGRVRKDAAGYRAPNTPGPDTPGGKGAAPRSGRGAQDMVKCKECGAYVVPDSATPCGRAGCPYGR